MTSTSTTSKMDIIVIDTTGTTMPSCVITLPREEFELWLTKHQAYRNEKNKDRRARLLFDFFIYTYRKVGELMAFQVICDELNKDSPPEVASLTFKIVKHWAGQPDFNPPIV